MKQANEMKNWQFILLVVAILFVFLIAAVMFTITRVTEAVAPELQKTTEFMMMSPFMASYLYNQMIETQAQQHSYFTNRDPFEVMMFFRLIDNDISTSADIDFDFKAGWTKKQIRKLEKVDLNCVDEYTYVVLDKSTKVGYVGNNIEIAKLRDKGCSIEAFQGLMMYDDTKNVYWRCPVRNCAMKEVIEYDIGEFIPESFRATRLKLDAENKVVKQ